MEEYVALREELISNSQVAAQFLIMSITAAVAILGFGIQSQRRNGLLFLAPFLLTIPAVWFITSQVESSVRIAAYIKTTIEPNHPELHWETDLLEFRERNPHGRPDSDYLFAISTIYRIIAIACVLLSVGVAVNARWQQMTGGVIERVRLFRSPAKWAPVAVLLVLGVTAFLVEEAALANLSSAFTHSYEQYVAQWEALRAE